MKNYTSSVPVERTIMQIEKVLSKYDVMRVAKEYKNGEVSALTFTVLNPVTNKELRVRLPANPAGVASALERQYKVTHTRKISDTALRTIQAQAARTAWKLMQDWLEVQLSLIEMEQAEFTEIFLPYFLVLKDTTYYQQLKQENFRALPEAKETK